MIIAFDLDGTIFTSEAILGPAYQACVSKFNRSHALSLRTPTAREVLDYVGRPGREIVAALFPELAPEQITELAETVVRDLVNRIGDRQGRIFDGVPGTLEALAAAGHPLAIVSNCRRCYLEAILAAYDLNRFFFSAACNEDAPELGKNGLLKRTLAGQPGIMVGDRASDGVAARFAGVRWIGCHFGHSIDDDAELAGADAVAHSFPEILSVVERWAEPR